MGKNYNSADAFRKAAKKKELRKNATDRKKKRDDKTAKSDTRDLEAEISHLKSRDKLSDEAKERLAKAESELKYVSRLKDKYVAAHPEAKDKIFTAHGDKRHRHPGQGHDDDDHEHEPRPDPMTHLYNADGTLRDPKKSAYYDPTYNPFGVPPPGMPYRERTPGSGDESDSDSDGSDSDADSDDSDIVMPSGPRPDEESDDDSDDSMDIPLPEGPPPPRPPPALPAGPPRGPGFGPRGHPYGGMGHGPRHPVRPAPYPPRVNPANPGGWGHLMPGPGPMRGPPVSGALPSRPGGLPAPPSSLPAKPGSAPIVSAPTTTAKPAAAPTSAAPAVPPASATISAAPQLRDLRKEATVFVPRGVNRKKAPGGLAPINAAPQAGPVDAEGDSVRVRAPASSGLMGKLSGVLGAESKSKPADEGEDEYARFLEGLE